MARATPADVQKAARTWLDASHYTLHVNPMPPVVIRCEDKI